MSLTTNPPGGILPYLTGLGGGAQKRQCHQSPIRRRINHAFCEALGCVNEPWRGYRATRKPAGVIACNTLVDHSGKLIEDVGFVGPWQRHVIAHDYLTSVPRAAIIRLNGDGSGKRTAARPRTSRITRRCRLDWMLWRGTFPAISPSYFTHAKVLNHIHAKQRHYVGALKLNRKGL